MADARPTRAGADRHRQRDPVGEGRRHQLAVPRAASCARSASTLRRIVVIPDELDVIAAAVRALAPALRRALHLRRRRADARRRDDRRRRARARRAGDPPSGDRAASCASSSATRSTSARLKMAEVPEGTELDRRRRARASRPSRSRTSTSCPASRSSSREVPGHPRPLRRRPVPSAGRLHARGGEHDRRASERDAGAVSRAAARLVPEAERSRVRVKITLESKDRAYVERPWRICCRSSVPTGIVRTE